MRTVTRATAVAAATFTAAAVAAPALATTLIPTSLNLRAAKATVKAHHSEPFRVTLSQRGHRLAGQTLVVQERTAPTSGHRTSWVDQAVVVTDQGNGVYTFTVTPPIASKKNTQKDQYRVLFKKTATYAGSHSQVITVTVRRSA
jgi:hypothetical protein